MLGPWHRGEKGRFTSVCCALEQLILAFSAASFRRCSAGGRSAVDAILFLELVGQEPDQAMIEIFAPRKVSPLVDSLEHAVADSSTDTSKVPPPRS